MTDVRVTVVTNPIQRTAFWAIFVGVIAIVFIKWVLLILGAILVGGCLYVLVQRWRTAQLIMAAREEEIRARADAQNGWFAAGDPRGMFGDHWRNDEGPVA